MYVNLIFEESKGLQHDAKVICALLFKQGHVVYYNHDSKTDLGIFLEHIYKQYLPLCDTFIFFPNLEWLTMFDINNLKNPKIRSICCKTRDACAKLGQITNKCTYTSMDSMDMYDGGKKVRECIHIKGTSMYKNTQKIVDLWKKHPEWPRLHVVYRSVIDIKEPIEVGNIVLYQWDVMREELCKLMNRCMIHVCCSYCEGFGHYINEARSVGGYVITTNGTPMNEHIDEDCGCLVKIRDRETVKLFGEGYDVEEGDLENAIKETLEKTMEELETRGKNGRRRYEENKRHFEKKMLDVING